MTVIPFPGAHVTEPSNPAAPSCVIGRRPHPAVEGHLCQHHFDELDGWLRDIEDEAARLSTAPRMETSYDTSGTSLASHRVPLVIDAAVMTDPRTKMGVRVPVGPVCGWCAAGMAARCTCPPGPTEHRDVHWAGCPRQYVHPSCVAILAHRDERGNILLPILGVLHGWAQRVRDERELEPPAGTVITPLASFGEWARTMTVSPTVMSERRVLTRQLRWIAGRPWAGDMRRQIGELRHQLLALNRNTDPDPLPGYCYRLVDGEECHGDLWPAEPVHTSGYESREGYRAVACSRHPKEHRWEGDDLPRLLVIIDQQKSRKEVAS